MNMNPPKKSVLIVMTTFVLILSCTVTPSGQGNGSNSGNSGNNGGNNGGSGGDNSGGGSGGPGNGGSGGTTNGVSGGFDPATGLHLETDGISLDISSAATPSNTSITMRRLGATDLVNLGLAADNGFEDGIEFGPTGTTFAAPVDVDVLLTNPSPLDQLAVLTYDESAHTWGDSGVEAEVTENGTHAHFTLNHFSDYDIWNPPPPTGSVAIGDGEVIAGTGNFDGQPFNTLPSPSGTSASLTYSDFGDVFALAMIQLDATNPATGDQITLAAGLHSSQVTRLNEGVIVGVVAPDGDFTGPSFFDDGQGLPKPISGVMFLHKTDTQWMVDVYAEFQGGLVFGQATGDLGSGAKK